MCELSVTEESVAALGDLLPEWVASMSLGRAQLVLDQIRAAVTNDPDDVILLIARRGEETLAAAVVLHVRETPSPGPADSATVLHAAPTGGAIECQESAAALADELDRVLRSRGVTFVQWATDLRSPGGDSVASAKSDPASLSDSQPPPTGWESALGFQSVADLDYLSGTLDKAEKAVAGALNLRPVLWSPSSDLIEFTGLVERSYIDTADCPQLSKLRSAAQSVRGYRDAGAFAPHLWWHVVDDDDQPIGALILADHTQGDSERSIFELVYMGLIPEARGKGLGRALLRRAIGEAIEQGAEQMIMAVDRTNAAACKLYREAGFATVLLESVWAKSLG